MTSERQKGSGSVWPASILIYLSVRSNAKKASLCLMAPATPLDGIGQMLSLHLSHLATDQFNELVVGLESTQLLR